MDFKYLVVYSQTGSTGRGDHDTSWHNRYFTLQNPVTEADVRMIHSEIVRYGTYSEKVVITNIIPLAG